MAELAVFTGFHSFTGLMALPATLVNHDLCTQGLVAAVIGSMMAIGAGLSAYRFLILVMANSALDPKIDEIFAMRDVQHFRAHFVVAATALHLHIAEMKLVREVDLTDRRRFCNFGNSLNRKGWIVLFHVIGE